MSLFADNHLGRVPRGLATGLPLGPFFRLFRRRLGPFEVIFFAVDEHDDVGVLLDRARFAEVGELWALVLALLDLAGQLRQRQDRDIQFLVEHLQPPGDVRYLLRAIAVASARFRPLHEL